MFPNLVADTRRLRELKRKRFPWYVLESLLFENGYQAVVLHRLAHWFKRRGIPFFGPFFNRFSLWLTGVDIAPAAEIGPGLRIGHGVGLVIGGAARIGRNAFLLHGVTIGAPGATRLEEMPTVGDDVFIGAGATLIGPIVVGDGAVIGASALVTSDVPPGARALAPPAIIQPRGMTPDPR
jgi:serine O-acetyltransferase